MPLSTLIGLILANLVWSANPAMGKIVMSGLEPQVAAWARYAGAWIAYAIVIAWLRWRQPRVRPEFSLFELPKGGAARGYILLTAFLTFCFSPTVQMAGLARSTATANALIVAMEPLFTVLMAWAVLNEKLTRAHALLFLLAMGGFFLLAGVSPDRGLVDAAAVPLLGNLLILASMVGEGMFSVAGRRLARDTSPWACFGTTLGIGLLLLTVTTAWISGPGFLRQLLVLEPRHVFALIWIGPLGTAFGYAFWLLALRTASVATIALTLFIQPVAGAVWGMVFLGERLSLVQWGGAGLILVAVSSQSALLGLGSFGAARLKRVKEIF